ncbi:hypothetical protein BGZ96_009763, partial [Linnemannia gamsii]
MEPAPSNTTQFTASDVPTDDPVMNGKLTLDRIEHAVVNVLNEVGQYIAKAEAAEKDGEENQEDIKNEDIKTEDGIE